MRTLSAAQFGTWALRLAEYGAVQGIAQFMNAISGLLIVHALDKAEYAFFAIANSFLTACNLLADLGAGVGLRSIGGRHWNDPRRLGALFNTTIGLRRRFALAAFGGCVPLMAWMLWANGAPGWLIVALCIAVLVAALPVLTGSALTIVAQLVGDYRGLQKLDAGSAAMRLVLVAALALWWLNALLASLVGALVNWMQWLVLRRRMRAHADTAAAPHAEDRRELVRLSWKSLPNAVFFCLQGQVTLLILTFFGTTSEIADFTALGRLAAIFAVFSATFGAVIAPRFARTQDPERLAGLYRLLLLLSALALAPVAIASWLFPHPFLWLLGSKYAGLEAECGWVVTTGCLGQFLGVMWALNLSKAWIRFQSVGFIPAILVCQCIAAALLDLRQFHDVLIFALASAVAPLPLYIADALSGLREARKGTHAA